MQKDFVEGVGCALRSLSCVLAIACALTAPQVMAMGAGNGGGPEVASASVADARKGEELFGRNCQQCHNSRGKGGKGPQLVRGAWAPGGANSDDYMFKVIAEGRPNTQMGGWRNSLSEQAMRQIIAFLREEARRVAITEQDSDDDGQWY
jgi:mono/diheme cytochrome c family protein